MVVGRQVIVGVVSDAHGIHSEERVGELAKVSAHVIVSVRTRLEVDVVDLHRRILSGQDSWERDIDQRGENAENKKLMENRRRHESDACLGRL